ncbi:MAG: YIP1 family protein [Armatimonadetes bacterium]|nr:YIP1 family protein [Armatimonadota bacterium]
MRIVDDAYEPPSGPEMNPLQTLMAVVTRPQAAFDRLARKPEWGIPSIMLLAGIGTLYTTSMRFAGEAMKNMPQQPGMPALSSEFMMILSIFLVPIISAGTWFIRTGVLWVTSLLFGGEGEFLALLSAIGYAWLPFFIQHALMTVWLVIAPDQAGQQAGMNIQDPAVLRRALIFSVGQHIGPFAIWNLILCVIAVATVLRLSRGQAVAVVLIPWFLQLIWRIGYMLFSSQLAGMVTNMTPPASPPSP